MIEEIKIMKKEMPHMAQSYCFRVTVRGIYTLLVIRVQMKYIRV